MKKLLIGIFMLSALAGCASVPMGSAQQDAALKTFTVPPDKAGIYIYRNESFGASVKMDVAVDSKPIGQTAANTYLYEQVSPGMHVVTSKAENTDSIKVDAKAGTMVFIWQEVKMGILYARNKLHLMSTSEGEAGVNETHLAVSK
ncbi:MAG: DUF2846 domain-containing protein [Acidobacteriaceae bacterium]